MKSQHKAGLIPQRGAECCYCNACPPLNGVSKKKGSENTQKEKENMSFTEVLHSGRKINQNVSLKSTIFTIKVSFPTESVKKKNEKEEEENMRRSVSSPPGVMLVMIF